jgi:hypothetical protein
MWEVWSLLRSTDAGRPRPGTSQRLKLGHNGDHVAESTVAGFEAAHPWLEAGRDLVSPRGDCL